MKNLLRQGSKLKDQRGVTAIVVAILMTMFIGFVALAVDIGYVMVTKNELQNIVDAASLAAARQLGAIYQPMSYEEQQAYVCDPLTIVSVAVEVAAKNQAGGVSITINPADIIIGQWDGSSLTQTLNQPDAVEVTARREEGSANGPIATFFARIFGVDTIDVSADATAALTGPSEAEPGVLELPIGISKSWFDTSDTYCGEEITFYPTNDSCAGWTGFEDGANDNTIRQILNGDIISPETIAGQTSFNFTGGTLSTQTFNALLTLFQNNGYDVLDDSGDTQLLLGDDGVQLLYPDGTPRNVHAWDTTVVVYDWGVCDNPTGSIPIIGFTEVRVTDVLNAPDKLIIAQVLCDYVETEDVRGGGGEFGSKGPIPNLVE